MPSLRDFVNQLEKDGQVLRITKPASTRFEIPAALKEVDGGPVVLFEKVKESRIPVVGNVCGTRSRFLKSLDVSASEFYMVLLNAMNPPAKARVVKDGPILEVEEEPDLTKLPILTHYERDAGPYITSSVVSARDPSGEIENVSVHRFLVVDRRRLTVRIVPRHLLRLFNMAKEKGQPLEVAVAIGTHPAVTLAASSSPPFGVSEFDVAASLLKGKLDVMECPHVNARAPADAEIVLECKILTDATVKEGPFVDLLGTHDAVRDQPIVEVVKVLRRRQPTYQALLGGSSEHRILMGAGREAQVWQAAMQVTPTVKAVNLSMGGCGWLHAIISIDKQTEGDGKNVLLAALSAHPSLKHAIVVDSDINVYDLEDVEWTVATRFRADRGLVVISNVRGSSLDPMCEPHTGTTAKMGIDATKPLDRPNEIFTKGKIPAQHETAERILKDLKLPNSGSWKRSACT
ncbi:MAG: UbiD family decarboxylase [Candidatus Bathyarchaeia archaeon]